MYRPRSDRSSIDRLPGWCDGMARNGTARLYKMHMFRFSSHTIRIGGWNASGFGGGGISGVGAIDFWTRAKKITTKWSDEFRKDWNS